MASSKSKKEAVMDDVDRLFECFKCGISPPQSAARERKRSKIQLKNQGISIIQVSPGSVEQPPKNKNEAVAAVKGKNFSGGKRISPAVFYGSPQGVPPKRPISLLRLLREIRVDLAEQQKPNLSKEVWATFPRQNEAMNFAKEHANVRIFSYQDHHNGQRRFLVTSYKEFWRRYKNMDPKYRHHYEVIQEGLSCHLCFDLEFNRRDNSEKNGDEMVDLLILIILEALLEKSSIQGNRDWIVELDSSTPEKFSRHLIIHIPKTAFKDNTHAGAFVSECEEDMFMASLICNMDVDCDKLLVCKMDMECVKTLHFDTEVTYDFRRCHTPKEFTLNGVASDTAKPYIPGKSPFPTLDKFIESIAAIGSLSGKIRSWYWFSEHGLMVYSMSRNRYCERIDREHKSNHVIYVVDLRRADYYQKCHDPDCQGYRSPLRPIPLDVIPDPPFLEDSVQMADQIASSNDDLEFQYVRDDCEDVLLYRDKHDTDSCSKDPWWLEAIKVADDIENKQKTSDYIN